MNGIHFLITFSIFTFIYMIIGLIYSRGVETTKDFFLAKRSLGFWAIAGSLIATKMGGGMFLGTAEKAYYFGHWGIFYTIGMSLGLLFLGLGFASKMRQLKISTIAEIFQVKYKSTFLRKSASFLSIISACGILAAQVIALKELLLAFGINNDLIIVLIWLSITSYTMFGGLKAVVVTDVYQAIFIILIFSGLFIYLLEFEDFSFFSLSNLLTIQKDNFINNQNALSNSLSIMFGSALFCFVEQSAAQRFFASKNQRSALISALFASFFLILLSFIPIYLGMKAKLMGINVTNGANPLITLLEQQLPNLIFALAATSLGVAIISTADSLLCAISSNVVQDFSSKKNVPIFVSRIATLVVSIIAFLIAYTSTDIINMLVAGYEVLVSGLFISVIFCFFSKKITTASAFGSMFSGIISFSLLKYIGFTSSALLISLIISSIFFLIGKKVGQPIKTNKNFTLP